MFYLLLYDDQRNMYFLYQYDAGFEIMYHAGNRSIYQGTQTKTSRNQDEWLRERMGKSKEMIGIELLTNS